MIRGEDLTREFVGKLRQKLGCSRQQPAPASPLACSLLQSLYSPHLMHLPVSGSHPAFYLCPQLTDPLNQPKPSGHPQPTSCPSPEPPGTSSPVSPQIQYQSISAHSRPTSNTVHAQKKWKILPTEVCHDFCAGPLCEAGIQVAD